MKIQNNKGFSLLELLISVGILAIILVPLLNNYVIATKSNQKARHIQVENNIAQNILEQVKGKSIADIAKEFCYPEDFPLYSATLSEMNLSNGNYSKVTNAANFSSIRSEVGAGSGIYEYSFVEKSTPYYFAMMNIEEDGRLYDALITFDSSNYVEDTSTTSSGYNQYEMPIISDLTSENHVVAIQQGEEASALTSLYNNHLMYYAQEEILYNATKKEDDPEYSENHTRNTLSDVTRALTKTIKVQFISSGTNVQAKIIFVYSASIPGAGSISYDMVDEILETTKDSIYILYQPSKSNVFDVTIDSSLGTLSYDIYMVEQETTEVLISRTINSEGLPGGITLYSNVDYLNLAGSKNNQTLVKREEAKNRIYRMKIQIFNAGSNFTSSELCTEFETTKEE